MRKNYDLVIIGGGFFGCTIALDRVKKFKKVLILEQGKDLLTRASYINQARVHKGYHYPRSILTAIRSRINYTTFIKDYKKCIVDNFDHYYGIGKHMSKISLGQYFAFCQRVGLDTKPAPEKIKKLFNPNLIEGVFKVRECVFDAIKQKSLLIEQLFEKKIDFKLDAKVTKIQKGKNDYLVVSYTKRKRKFVVSSKHVINCTYSRINFINKASKLPIIPLKHELTEMALIRVPKELGGTGVTVMCGPFFSFLPFPPEKAHCLSHVRYTPHTEWVDKSESNYLDPYSVLEKKELTSSYNFMVRDASRYLPLLSDSKYLKSIWEIKTVLPQSEWDDSRPILLSKNHGIKNYACIMGGKIDNIYDILRELDG